MEAPKCKLHRELNNLETLPETEVRWGTSCPRRRTRPRSFRRRRGPPSPPFEQFVIIITGRMGWMAHRKWKEIKQQPGTAGPGNMLDCCLLSFHFLWAIHPIRPVLVAREVVRAIFAPQLYLTDARATLYFIGFATAF